MAPPSRLSGTIEKAPLYLRYGTPKARPVFLPSRGLGFQEPSPSWRGPRGWGVRASSCLHLRIAGQDERQVDVGIGWRRSVCSDEPACLTICFRLCFLDGDGSVHLQNLQNNLRRSLGILLLVPP